jgi:hypothetical protein
MRQKTQAAHANALSMRRKRCLAQQCVEADASQIPREQLESGIRRRRDFTEVQRQIPIDTRLKSSFLCLTVKGLSLWMWKVGSRLLSTTTAGLFQFN